ncbi:sulfatase-like hydrolase/transferase [Isosphaeraceae bacterium EP7]
MRLPGPRRHWRIALLLALLPVHPDIRHSQAHAEQPVDAPPYRPNMLLIVCDDLGGGLLGIDGDPRAATPRLDTLAGQGVRFDHAYCNAPVCTASRASFITGRMPHAVGVTQLITPLPESVVTLGDWLGDLGYDTAAYGKMHFNSNLTHGFSHRLDTADWARDLNARRPGATQALKPFRPFNDPAPVWLNAAIEPVDLPGADMESTYIADRAIEFLRARRKKGDQTLDEGPDKPKPFALVVSIQQPHSPFKFPRDWPRRMKPDQFNVPAVSEADLRDQPKVFSKLTDDEKRRIMASYYTALSYADDQVGRLIDALDDAGLGRDTVVAFVGDNGYMLGQHGRFEKHCSFEPAIRVPLLVRWPGHLKPGVRVNPLVELVDLFPTLTDLAGLPDPPDLHGKSLVPLLRVLPDAEGRAFIVSEYTENEEAVVRTQRFKLVVGTGRRQRQDGYATGRPLPGPYEHLFNMRDDPDETHDLIDDPAATPARDRLRRALFDRMATTRGNAPPIPEGLSEMDAIRWCLVPRDHREP